MACWVSAFKRMRAAEALLPFSTNHVHFSVKFDATSEDVADLLDRHLAPGESKVTQAGSLLSTRADALSLYRMIWRYTILFDWPDDEGVIWRDKLRLSARQEFEASRHVSDPESVARLLVNGRQAVNQVMDRFLQKLDKYAGQNKEDPYFQVPIRT